MNNREIEKLEARKLLNLIRKEAGLTINESRLLNRKMELPKFDLSMLPDSILSKLRESAKKQGITEYKTPTGKVLKL